MSKKICFSSVLKQKRGSQNVLNKQPPQASLRELFQEFTMYPNGDFTLRYFQTNSLKGCNSKQGFDEGFNQLDQWIHSQKVHSNKENISDTQPRRQIPNQLLKYANGGCKSPRRLSQVKGQFSGVQHSQNSHKNVDMKEICREYAENKKAGRDLGKEAPVWKFAPQNQVYEEEVQAQKKPKFFREKEQVFREAEEEEEQFQDHQRFNQRESHQTAKPRQEKPVTHSKNQPQPQPQTQPQPKGQNIMKLVQEIKNNLVPQIEVMAERIIQEKALGQEEDQELLISQRESEEQRDQKRLDKARKEIGEYLTMKNGGSSSENKPEGSSIPVKKTFDETFEQVQDKITSSDNQHVGYSFSSDFQPQPQPHSLSQKNTGSMNRQQQQSMGKNKREPQILLNPCNKISLPNIDEVKSERDAMEKVEEYFGESANVTTISKPQNEASSIDKNYIKEIQSVAYVETPVENVEIIRNRDRGQPRQEEKGKEEKTDKKGSLFQQVSKTAMSIEGGVQEANEVNISVAEGKESPPRNDSKQGSARQRAPNVTPPPAEVNSFVSPASTVKIEFKKIPSPERLEKKEGPVTVTNEPQVTETNPTGAYFSRAYTPLSQTQPQTQIYTAQTSTTTYTAPPYKTSFGNIFQQTQKDQSHAPTHVSPVPQASIHQYQQNSRQRNNSLKNSNQEDQGRKLKITISPKYHGKEEDKYETVGNVTDFRLNNAKMEESAEGKYNPAPTATVLHTINQTNLTSYPPTIKSVVSTTPTTTVTIPSKQSITGASTKFKIDSMFTNVTNIGTTTVTQTREIHQESREKTQENALIRVEKYERVQKFVEPTKNSIAKQSIGKRNNQSIKSSQQFEFDLDF